MAKTRWVCVFCKRIMRSISGGLEELKSNKLFHMLFEKKKWRIQYSILFEKKMWRSPSKIHFKGFRNLSEHSFGRSSNCESSLNVPFVDFQRKLDSLFDIVDIQQSTLWRGKIFKMGGKNFHEIVTESIEFYESLRYSFAINSFSSFAVHISNIFNSFFSLRRYLRSFVKSVVKWNMENIADIVHGRDRLLT